MTRKRESHRKKDMINIDRQKWLYPLIMIIALVCVTFYAHANKKQSPRATKFIHFMLPLIHKTNHDIQLQRNKLMELYKKHKSKERLRLSQRNWLYQLAKKYKLSHFNSKNDQKWQALLSRVNTIPASLALAQSINESAFGRSRFAKEGHNYFGQWCYHKGCGIVPKRRHPGGQYEVAKFENAQASVSSYIQNLNTNPHYSALRNIRAQQARNDLCLRGFPLTQGLRYYSSRGQAYVNSLKAIIEDFHLGQYDCLKNQPTA